MNVQILAAQVEFVPQPFIKPLQLSSGTIDAITEAHAIVRVRVAGREAVGHGSIYLSDLWGWPDPALSHDTRDAAMRTYCESLAANLFALCGGEALHPLELGLRLHESVAHTAATSGEPFPPLLARLICASPFDAALHDATGQAWQRSAFDFYDAPAAIPTADAYFAQGAIAAIAQTLSAPRDGLAAWYLVGLADEPHDLAPWVRERGYHCFKIKIGGKDNAADVARTRQVFAQVRELGAREIQLSVDSNCANPDAQSVADYLERLEREDTEAYGALQFVEQPTERDIARYPHLWHAVSRRKPVLIDEGLVGFEVFPFLEEQGWGGLALKTCKGHSFALVAAAWAHQRGLLLSMQDLTNPGYAAIHAALLTARLPTNLGIELNSPQYTPAANEPWLPRLAPFFRVEGGVHRLPDWNPAGLGSAL